MIDAHKFIYAGKACFTLTDQISGNHYTYRINRKDPEAYAIKQYQDGRSSFKPQPVWFVSLGVGYEDSIYIGMLKDSHQRALAITKGSRAGESSPSVRMLNKFLGLAVDGAFAETEIASDIRFQHVGRCCVCARPLTNPESIEAGIGPECSGRQ